MIKFTLRKGVDFVRAVAAAFKNSPNNVKTTSFSMTLARMCAQWNSNSGDSPDVLTRVKSQMDDMKQDLRTNVEKLQTRGESIESLGSRASFATEVIV